MANYKNQNTITDISVNKIKHNTGVEEPWMQPFKWDAMKVPFFLLTGNEYKFYMYLFSWAGKGTYDFSPAALQQLLDISEDTARKIFKTFIDYGYLIQIGTHRYSFDPAPEKAQTAYNKKWAEKFGLKIGAKPV